MSEKQGNGYLKKIKHYHKHDYEIPTLNIYEYTNRVSSMTMVKIQANVRCCLRLNLRCYTYKAIVKLWC